MMRLAHGDTSLMLAATAVRRAVAHVRFSSAWRQAKVTSSLKSVPGEPEKPSVKTAIPGPKSKELLAQLDKFQDTKPILFFSDFEKSKGNYVVDADGNTMLDMYCHIASLPVGYNHPMMEEASRSEKWHRLLMQRPALGSQPNLEFPQQLEETMRGISPKGLTQVQMTCGCGSSANENAYKAVFMAHQYAKRGNKPPTQADLDSCMINMPPGSPALSMLSFEGGFHGRTFGCLSTTRSKAIHKVDIPALPWPVAPFPKLRYPLEKFEKENKEEEDRCLKAVENIIKTNNVPVAGLIVEPVLAEGGDKHASPYFFRKLREITARNGVAMIVDEVQTGVGATGAFWAHELWNLETPPDIVTFSKKMQASGYFYADRLRPDQPYRIYNTWMGDSLRLLQAKAMIDIVKSNKLVENTKITGDFTQVGLKEIAARRPELLSNVRGLGTFIAVDAASPADRDALLSTLRQKGINMGGCGAQSIRLRPSLIYAPKHANVFLDVFESVVGEHKMK
eukprot:TRINITY_DN14449_c0_g1_i1.p1 TRINITY_DN14449_c0_g1~~TRINITY_DN14449_c0_g1_i1.p1  ORF type:complete len:507 (-),score=131.26 TRINITY_DN14449_c0_g1_i1:64-1584(-)